MAQHDYVIANDTFPAVRGDINNALSAVVTVNSGATSPSTTYAAQLWYDSANNILKMRNEDNDAWINLFLLNQVDDTAQAVISDNNDVVIQGENINLKPSDGASPNGFNNGINIFEGTGGVEIYHNNVKVLSTSADAVDITKGLKTDITSASSQVQINSGGTLPIDLSLSDFYYHTLTADVTTVSFSNIAISNGTVRTVIIEVKQDASASGYTIAWPSSIDWAGGSAPTLTSTANAIDMFVLYTRDNGTNWYGFVGGQDIS